MNVLKMLLFTNGNIAVFRDGKQVPALQRSAIDLWAEYAERYGYDPEGVEVETQDGVRWKIFKTEDGWNRKQIL